MKSGYDPQTGIYNYLIRLKGKHKIPTQTHLDTATFVLSQFPGSNRAESKVAVTDSATNHRVTYCQQQRSIHSLAAGLYHRLGVRKGDVVFLLSPNSTLYPTISVAILLVGAVVTTANPVNIEQEITKQVLDSGAKLSIAAHEEMHKLLSSKVTPAEHEAILLSHPHILDAAVIPLEDEEAGEIPMTYIVMAAGSDLSEDQVMQFVASQVAPFKMIKRVAFINEIPKSLAGKILRKDLVAKSRKSIQSKDKS